MKAHVLIAVVLLIVGVAQLHAGIISVTNTNDSGPGSLRDALANAANGDTISISATGMILLTSGELFVTKSLNIVGPSPDLLAVDGDHLSRVFHIGPNTTVSISSLTVTNGFDTEASLERGGGIYNDHATLTVSNCAVNGNLSTRVGAGGIVNDAYEGSATLTIVNSILSGNSTIYLGGGIFNLGEDGSATVTILNSTVSGNMAEGGGGVYNLSRGTGSAVVTVIASAVSGNSASREGGGGITNERNGQGSATLTVIASTLSSNSASYGGGGGIVNAAGIVEIRGSVVSGNSAGGGGGIVNLDAGTGSTTLTIANSTLSSNSASYAGGGILNVSGGGTAVVQIVNSTLSGNSATNGGAIFTIGEPGGSASVEIGSSILNAGALGANITNYALLPGFVPGLVTSLGYNLSSDSGSGFLTNATDQINTDPMLGPLQDNGGPTFTHALLCGSPAIDQGKNFNGDTTDQRGDGFARTFDDPNVPNAAGGDGTDIGAFEVQQQIVCSPVEQIDDLIALVQGLGLQSGTANSLIVKLEAATNALGRGNNQAACGSLGAFLNEVNAQTGKKLTAAEADTLIAEATRIRAGLGC